MNEERERERVTLGPDMWEGSVEMCILLPHDCLPCEQQDCLQAYSFNKNLIKVDNGFLNYYIPRWLV